MIGFGGGGGGGGGLVDTIADSDSIDLTVVAAQLSGVVRLSSDAADAGSTIVSIDVRTGASKGLRAQVLNATIRALLSATGPLAYDNATGVISIPVATDSVSGYLSSADHTTYSAAAALAHAAVTLAAFGSTPNANGATLTTQALTIEPADETHPGAVSLAAQVFGGEKRFPGGTKVGSNAALSTSVIFEVASTTKFSVPFPAMTPSQRNAVPTPTTGSTLYNINNKHPEFWNGAVFEPVGHSYETTPVSVTDASTITPVDARSQMIEVSGNGGAVSVANIGVGTAKNCDKILLVCTSDTNTVTFVSASGVQLNGSCTLASGDVLQLIFVSTLSKWVEIGRTV